MKKIGIITHYYKSTNFGGNLQAYALCKFLNLNGYNAEQISFPFQPIIIKRRLFKGKGIKEILKMGIKVINRLFIVPIKRYLILQEEKKRCVSKRRARAVEFFNNELIPHSNLVYNSDNVQNCIQDYSIFITGSDQVWNFTWYNSAYFLDFVPSYKTKISYAASIASDSLTDEQKESFCKSLKDYKAVSVREKSAEKLLEGLSPVEIQTVLDPTLLLTSEEWDEVCADRVIEDAYIFCYFLGNNKKERKLAEKFSRKKGLKLVAIPHTAGIKLNDRNFGDERLYDASPEQFISLIKHAKYIFTDSFHAVVFSNIYRKQYFVFNRSSKDEMSSRIVDITELFHQQERFCVEKERETLEYISSLDHIDYTNENKEFEKAKSDSIEFLKRNLEDCNG